MRLLTYKMLHFDDDFSVFVVFSIGVIAYSKVVWNCISISFEIFTPSTCHGFGVQRWEQNDSVDFPRFLDTSFKNKEICGQVRKEGMVYYSERKKWEEWKFLDNSVFLFSVQFRVFDYFN